jgi:secreted trypsin-like serine protease
MRLVAVLLLVAYCEARPSAVQPALFEPGFGSFIIGGQDATPGQFPYQLSQTRTGSHSCGASLLSANYALSAAHCVDGALVGVLGIIAGLHNRNDMTGAVSSAVSSYTTHASYNDGSVTFANDIAIIRLSTPIPEQGWIQFASLPADNGNDFAGQTCQISGWGRTSSSNVLPNTLQWTNIGVISQAACNTALAPVSGANVGPGQICLSGNGVGSCNGDSGGPLTCGSVVAGVTSWGIQSGGACSTAYPSIYTRTSFFLQWITDNTP